MRSFSLICLIVLSGVLASATICVPEFLGSNAFLLNFIENEYINVLVVIVTVSFVSVTQIHLEYSRVERRFGMRAFREARQEVNFGAILLVFLLMVSFPLVIFKSSIPENIVIQSALHSAAIVILVSAIFVMYDFVRTIYVLAAEEPLSEEDEGNDRT